MRRRNEEGEGGRDGVDFKNIYHEPPNPSARPECPFLTLTREAAWYVCTYIHPDSTNRMNDVDA